MNQFDYLIPFVGIIYALSATDLLTSAHRLIIDRQSTKFHIVPIIWACVAFLLIINGWWGFFQVNEKIELQNAGQLFVLSLIPLILFLIASLSLPHKTQRGLCMWTYFDEHKVPFYICHIAYLLIIPLVLTGFAEQINYKQVAINTTLGFGFFALIWFKHWLWHLAAGTLFLLSLLQSIFKQVISL